MFGILKEEGDKCFVDTQRCARLVQTARPFKSVFHRAFDEIVSSADLAWEMGLEAVAACGFDGILTSGGLGNAIDHVEMLGNIIGKARGLGIEIIVGGGVRTVNAGLLVRGLGLGEKKKSSVYFHSACLCGDGSESVSPGEVRGILGCLM